MGFFARPALRWLFASAAVLIISCNAWAQSQYSPPLWEVRSGEKVAYLFGTIHVGNPEFYPLPAQVSSALRKCDVLALEVDPSNEQEAVNAVMSAMYAPPDSIENHLAPALLSSVTDIAARYGVQFQQIRQMKPYLLMFTLTTLEYARLGYNATQGLENHLAQWARDNGKPVVSLESMSQQMQMLDSLSPQLQTAMLRITVEEIANDEVSGLVADMVKAWRSSDIARLQTVLSVEERRLPKALASEFHQRFLTERNVTMARQLDRMLAGGQRVFVAVGAMHMVGEDGIPALLGKMGYKVRPL